MNWLPDRKVLAGGLGGIVAWIVMFLLQRYAGITLPPDMQTMLVGGVTTAVAYVVPPSARDIVKRLNDGLVAMAVADPEVPVSGVPRKASTTVIDGITGKTLPIILVLVLVLPALGACSSVRTVESAAPGVTATPITQAVQTVKDMPPEEKWRLTCLAGDGLYIGYVAMVAPKLKDETNVKVQAGYEGLKSLCADKPTDYAAAAVAAVRAFNAFKAAMPAKAAT